MLGANEDFIYFFFKGNGGEKNANWKLRNEFVVIEKLQLKKKNEAWHSIKMWHCDFYSPPPNHSLISSEYIVCANPSISQSLINILGFIQSLCSVRVRVCVSVCSLVVFKGTLPTLPCHLSGASSAAVTRPAHTTQLQVLMGVNKGADFMARLSKTHKLSN